MEKYLQIVYNQVDRHTVDQARQISTVITHGALLFLIKIL